MCVLAEKRGIAWHCPAHVVGIPRREYASVTLLTQRQHLLNWRPGFWGVIQQVRYVGPSAHLQPGRDPLRLQIPSR